jgi:hypothetical protein
VWLMARLRVYVDRGRREGVSGSVRSVKPAAAAVQNISYYFTIAVAIIYVAGTTILRLRRRKRIHTIINDHTRLAQPLSDIFEDRPHARGVREVDFDVNPRGRVGRGVGGARGEGDVVTARAEGCGEGGADVGAGAEDEGGVVGHCDGWMEDGN